MGVAVPERYLASFTGSRSAEHPLFLHALKQQDPFLLSQVSTDRPRALRSRFLATCKPPLPSSPPSASASGRSDFSTATMGPFSVRSPPRICNRSSSSSAGDSQPQPARRRALTDLRRETLGIKRETRVSRENTAPLAERHLLKGRTRSRRLLKQPGSKQTWTALHICSRTFLYNGPGKSPAARVQRGPFRGRALREHRGLTGSSLPVSAAC